MSTPRFIIAPADPAPRAPNWPVRPGGWDTHAHVFGPAAHFPVRADALYDAPDQTGPDYLAMLDALGLGFGVLVQPSVYGQDNGCMLAAMAAAGGRLRGVIDIDPLEAADSEIAAFDAAGVCGIRLRPASIALATLGRIGARLREIGWHLDIHVDTGAVLAEVAPALRGLDVPIVIEAMGGARAGDPIGGPGFQALLGLLADGDRFVKLSHAYHVDPAGLPYAGALPLARAILAQSPDRALWGSDWPHPMRGGVMPNDGLLLDLLFDWAERDAALANAILIDNPSRAYARPA